MWIDGQKDVIKLFGIFSSFVAMHQNGYGDVNLTELAKMK